MATMSGGASLASMRSIRRRRGDEARILGQAEEVVDVVVAAPMPQLFAGKPRVGTQQDAHARPAGADVSDKRRLERPGHLKQTHSGRSTRCAAPGFSTGLKPDQ